MKIYKILFALPIMAALTMPAYADYGHGYWQHSHEKSTHFNDKKLRRMIEKFMDDGYLSKRELKRIRQRLTMNDNRIERYHGKRHFEHRR